MDMRKNHYLLRVGAFPHVSFCVALFLDSHAINALSFSHDGEYLAISNTSTYIDIVGPIADITSSLPLT